MKCVITGANGFLGQCLIKRLIEKGHSAIGLVRRSSSMAEVKTLGAEAEQTDLFDSKKLTEIFQKHNPEVIFHLAAEIATQRDRKLIYKVNVEGTQLLAKLASEIKGLKAFVFASSVVIGDPQGELIDETSELIATTTYGKSKQQGEALLLEEMKKNGLPVVVLRPSHIYGPGGWYKDLASEMLKGRFLIPGSGKNWWDVVHVEDVVEAFVLAAEKPMVGEVFHVVDDSPISMDDFFFATAKALNLSNPWHVPKFIAALVRGSDPISAAVRSAKSSNKKLKEKLNWKPKFPNAEIGIKDCIGKIAFSQKT